MRALVAATLALALLAGTAQGADKPALAHAGLRDLQRLSPTLKVDLRYGTPRNFTGKGLPGYCRPWALMLAPAARDLATVQRELRRRGLGLKVFDAYRPARASRAMVRWARRSGHPGLVGTYIARRSRHNLGSAVDLTLVRARDGSQPPMGTRFDHLGPRANTVNARGRVLRWSATASRTTAASGGTSSTACAARATST